jgi:hypothetical protein
MTRGGRWVAFWSALVAQVFVLLLVPMPQTVPVYLVTAFFVIGATAAAVVMGRTGSAAPGLGLLLLVFPFYYATAPMYLG